MRFCDYDQQNLGKYAKSQSISSAKKQFCGGTMMMTLGKSSNVSRIFNTLKNPVQHRFLNFSGALDSPDIVLKHPPTNFSLFPVPRR